MEETSGVDHQMCDLMVAMEIPTIVTHYYLAQRRPFLNLSDVPDDQLPSVIADLQELSRSGQQTRTFGRVYVEWRRVTERALREGFDAAGGQRQREAPHYFVLGTSPWYEGLAAGMRSVTLDLASLPDEHTSWTLTDSFDAMGCGGSFGFPAREDRDTSVYRLADLDRVLAHHPLYDERPDAYDLGPGATIPFVEVQLWSDEPVAHLLD